MKNALAYFSETQYRTIERFSEQFNAEHDSNWIVS